MGKEPDSIVNWDENHFTEKGSIYIFSKFIDKRVLVIYKYYLKNEHSRTSSKRLLKEFGAPVSNGVVIF